MDQNIKREWLITCWLMEPESIPDPFYDIYLNIYNSWLKNDSSIEGLFQAFKEEILNDYLLSSELDRNLNYFNKLWDKK
jgi:hypothetical protein